MYFRSFILGAALGAAFAGVLPGLFLALPVMMLAIVILSGVATGVMSMVAHPALVIVIVLGVVVACFRSIRWLSLRNPKASTNIFAALYAGFYGLFAYGISGDDWIWGLVIGGAAGGYVYQKATNAFEALEAEAAYALSQR